MQVIRVLIQIMFKRLIFSTNMIDKINDYRDLNESYQEISIVNNSNMTWFFSPIKSTDTNSALFPDISALAHWQ